MPPITVVAYDPAWPAEFARESASVSQAINPVLIAIHHIGSTAIPGMWAKPVIDMLAIVSNIAELDGRNELGEPNAKMQALGYEAMGEFGIPGRRYFRKDNAAGMRTHQIHAFQIGSPQIERHLAFRDFLTAHGQYAARYAELKRCLAARYPNDLAAYMDGKDAFIREIDAKALIWRQFRHHEPCPPT